MRESPEMRVTAGANGSANCQQRFRSSTSRMTTETQRPDETKARQHSNSPATIKIVLDAINRRGRSSASLPDGTVLVASSRQPFLDAARALVEKVTTPIAGSRGGELEQLPSLCELDSERLPGSRWMKPRPCLRNGSPFPRRRSRPASIIPRYRLPP
jgi:hypothetical protein